MFAIIYGRPLDNEVAISVVRADGPTYQHLRASAFISFYL